MGYVDIRVLKVAGRDDLKHWEDHMLVKAKCWHNFCFGVCDENEICAVLVTKEGKSDITYLTTLCEECIKTNASYGVLVDEKHLMVEPIKKLL